LVVLLIAISQITNLLFLRIFGRLSDKFSNKSVLGVCCPLYLFCVVFWPFTTLPESYVLTFPLLIIIHIFLGIATAGTVLSINNISLKLAPEGKGNVFIAITTIFTSISLGIAPIVGGLLIEFFELSELSWTIVWNSPEFYFSIQTLNFRGIDFLFILAFILGFFSLHRLAIIKEQGEVKNKVVLRELFLEIGKSMKNLSIVGGFRSIFLNPFHIKIGNFQGKR